MSWYDGGGFGLKVLNDGKDRGDHMATILMSVYVGDGKTVHICLTKSDLLMIRRDVNRAIRRLQENK